MVGRYQSLHSVLYGMGWHKPQLEVHLFRRNLVGMQILDWFHIDGNMENIPII